MAASTVSGTRSTWLRPHLRMFSLSTAILKPSKLLMGQNQGTSERMNSLLVQPYSWLTKRLCKHSLMKSKMPVWRCDAIRSTCVPTKITLACGTFDINELIQKLSSPSTCSLAVRATSD